MTAEERGGNEDDLDVFRPQRPLPLSADIAQRLFEDAWPADPAPYADPSEGADGYMEAGPARHFARGRPLGMLLGTAILAVCGLLVVSVVRESPASGSDDAGASGAYPEPGSSLPALPGITTDTRSPSPTLSEAQLEPGLDTAASRIPATVAAQHSVAGSETRRAGTSAKPRASASASAAHSATSKPTQESTRWSLRSVNYPDRYWAVRDGLGYLDPVSASSSAGTRGQATFTVVAGLADSDCYSFRLSNGLYLRHRDFRIRADVYDGSSLFRQDATFCAHRDAYSGTVSFSSFNYPGRYLRHRNFQLWIDPYQNTSLYRADSSFRIASALS